MKSSRTATISRKTKETEIEGTINLDGSGNYQINTGIPFFNHLLESMAKHGRFDIQIRAKGDIDVDYHHLVEDTGITLGEAFKNAIGKKGGIKRFSSCCIPMDEALVRVCLDISGRPYMKYNVKLIEPVVLHFDGHLIEDFFRAFIHSAGITLHVDRISGRNTHHIVKAVFKSFSQCLHDASRIIYSEKEVPSTKGML